jgi:hypothetical protein
MAQAVQQMPTKHEVQILVWRKKKKKKERKKRTQTKFLKNLQSTPNILF